MSSRGPGRQNHPPSKALLAVEPLQFTESGNMSIEAYATIYHALAAGEPDALTVFRIPPRIAAMAAEARKVRAVVAPKPLAAVTPRRAPSASAFSSSPAAPPPVSSSSVRNIPVPVHPNHAESDRASRAARVAEIYLAGINTSRKQCGLAPLDAATLAREFADVDRLPPRTKVRPLAASADPAADAMWSGIVHRLNASVAVSSPPIGARRALPLASSGRPTQTTVDWASIATGLNREAGLKNPGWNQCALTHALTK
jgi:hypothetical protein